MLAAIVVHESVAPVGTGPSGPPGWLTFHEAAPLAQQRVGVVAGGPWALGFATGIAADRPWAPMLLGTEGASPYCAKMLTGISLYTNWNDSDYRSSTRADVFSSGTAPLWSFGFVNASGATAVVSVLNGSEIFNGLWAESTGCAPYATANAPWGVSPNSVVDSSTVAGSETPYLPGGSGPTIFSSYSMNPLSSGPAFEMYTLAPSEPPVNGLDSGWGAPGFAVEWYVHWGHCVVLGARTTGWDNSTRFNATDGTWSSNAFGEGEYCSSTEHEGHLGPSVNGTAFNGTGTTIRWHITLDAPATSAVPAPANWTQLPMSSVTPTLSESNFTQDPTGAATCAGGTILVADCSANPDGWFVVLTDANGRWLDSYPTVSGGRNWTAPSVDLASGDVFELIVPSEFPSVKTLSISTLDVWFLGGDTAFV